MSRPPVLTATSVGPSGGGRAGEGTPPPPPPFPECPGSAPTENVAQIESHANPCGINSELHPGRPESGPGGAREGGGQSPPRAATTADADVARWLDRVGRRRHDERAREVRQLDQASAAWADWLELLAPWQWYATLTFRDPVHPEQADKCLRRWIHRINRRVFGVRYVGRTEGVRYCRALEWQRRGVIHFHLLIADVDALDRWRWMWEWETEGGYARIYVYDSKLGARFYLSKYVIKQGDLAVGGEFPREIGLLSSDIYVRRGSATPGGTVGH